MFVHRTYVYRLYPTTRQRQFLHLQIGAGRRLYNAALEHRRRHWREYRRRVTYGEQSAELRELRREGLMPIEANFWSQQEVLRRLDRAFRAFFRRVARGEAPGYPRFKTGGRFSTLCFSFAGNAGGVAIAGHPTGLVSALRKIEAASQVVPLDANPATAHMFIIKPFSGGGLMSLFSTHPPTEKRIQALLQL